MYYYPYLDKGKVKYLADTAGKAGHHIRNLCAGFVRIEFPELQIIDNLSGQLEGIARDIIGHMENNADIKILLRNSIRPSVCLLKILNDFQNGSISAENLERIKDLLGLQGSCFKEIDELVNEAIIKDSNYNYNGNFFCLKDKDAILKSLKSNFTLESNFEKLFSLDENQKYQLREFTEKNKEIAKFVCNFAHEIQNFCSKYIHKAPENALTSKIINIAGQIENKSRNIQDVFTNYNPNIIPNKTDHYMKTMNNLNEVCSQIITHIKEIEDVAIDEKCPIDITDEIFHGLLTKENVLTDILKSNLKVKCI